MKLRAYRIVSGAVERAIEAAVPYAVRRWYKYREACAAAPLLDSKDFQEHLREHVYGQVIDALGEVLDLDGTDASDDVPLKPAGASIAVYPGPAGWRWALVRDQRRTVALSSHHLTRVGALNEARWLADLTGLPVESSETPPETAA